MELLQHKLPKNIYQQLKQTEIISLDYFLLNSKLEICDKTKLPLKIIQNIIDAVSEIILNQKIVTGFELQNQGELWNRLYFGCPIIDKTIKGIPIRGITEIYGESGTAKTQLCLQLSLKVQKNVENGGLAGGTVYICTEDRFPSKRLQQILTLSKGMAQDLNYMDNVFVEHISDIEKLKNCILVRLPVLFAKNNIKLIIIDSITAVFRYDTETNDFISRSEDLKNIVTKLNNLSKSYYSAVVCVNQVTSDPSIGLKPCLGLSWSNLIQTRIELTRSGGNISYKNQNVAVRKMKMIFSPNVPRIGCNFVVTQEGVEGIS